LPIFHRFKIKNGPEVTFRQSPGCGMAAVYIFVMTGVRYESPEVNGISHFCEHLVFNGTNRITQKEMFNRMSFLGGHFNAVTRRDYTCFRAVTTSENFVDCMELLSEMLFSSNMEAGKFEKEKFVILEEISGSSWRDEYNPTRAFFRKIFAGSPYWMPVLGTRESVSKIGREQLLEYYHNYYTPSNIRILILGDLSIEKAKKFTHYFFSGPKTPDNSRDYTSFPQKELEKHLRPPAPYFNLYEDLLMHGRNLESGRNYIFLSIESPGSFSPQFLPFNLFSEIIYTGGKSGIEDRLKNSLSKHFNNFSIIYQFWKDAGLLTFRLLTHRDYSPGNALESLLAELLSVLENPIPQSDIDEFLITEEANRRYGEEKIDLYGLWEAQSFINMRFKHFSNFIEYIREIKPEEIRRTALEILSSPRWIAFAAGPGIKDGATKISMGGNFLARASKIFRGLPNKSALRKSLPPKESFVSEKVDFCRESREKEPVVKILPNGITIILEHRENSPIFAMCLKVKDPCLFESPDRCGTAEILMNLLSDGCLGMPRKEFYSRLNRMGAILKTSEKLDNLIDPYFLNQSRSIRLETLNRFAEESVKLLSDIILKPNLCREDIEIHQKQLLAHLKDQEKKSSTTALKLFYRHLTGGHPYSVSPTGKISKVELIGTDDLREFCKSLFSPGNIILAVETSIPGEEVFEWIMKSFPLKKDEKYESHEIIPFNACEAGRYRDSIDSERASVVIGFPVNIPFEDEAAMEIAVSLLHSQVSFRLREVQGFAYGVRIYHQKTRYGQFVQISLETRAENAKRAAESVKEILGDYHREFLIGDDIGRIRKNFRCRSMLDRLSSINRADNLASDLLLKDPLNFYKILLRNMEDLSPYRLREVLKKHFARGEIVDVIVT